MNFIRKPILVIFIILAAGTYASFITFDKSSSPKFKFAIVTPRFGDDIFWGPVVRLAKSAAKDFNIQLDDFHAGKNHIQHLEIIEKLMKEEYDAVITSNFKFQGIKNIKLAEQYKIPLVFITGSVAKETAGAPKEKYQYYVGEVIPDDINAGITLLDLLISETRKVKKYKEKLKMVAIEGNIAELGSILRKEGLISRLEKTKKIELLQLFAANWNPSLAKAKFKTVATNRFTDIDIVWCASDGMALGVIDAIKEMGLVPGKDIFIGGVDWTEGAFESIKRNELSTSVGGHVFQGAWAVVALFDYLTNPKKMQNGFSIETKMEPVPKNNISLYRDLIYGNRSNNLSFKSFSLEKNPKVKQHHFSVKELLKTMK